MCSSFVEKELGFHREQRVHHVTPSTTSKGQTMNNPAPDTLAVKLAEAAMTVLVRACRDEVASASNAELEVACASMRARAKAVVNQLLDDARGAPWIAETAFHAAALELAEAGISSLRRR
jgi:hypothetical protein